MTYPKGTTKEQWDKYYADLKAHDEYCERVKPQAELFSSEKAYENALSEWRMMRSCDAPNEPGYYRANND